MLVIGIAGGTGSGKTTVVNNILQQIECRRRKCTFSGQLLP